MKEASGEVSMTIVVIVILAALAGLATWLFSNDDVRNTIANMFTSKVNDLG